MAESNHNETKPDGAVFDDYFESLGKKAENLSSNDQKISVETNGTLQPDEEQKVVDEIESLCMNCHENVSYCILLLDKNIC